MTTIKVNDIEPDAYTNWIKESFVICKRSPFLFLLIALCPLLLCIEQKNVFLMVIILSSFFNFTLFFVSLKADYNLTIKETLKGFNFKENSFYDLFIKPHKLEYLFFVSFMIINVFLSFFVDNNKDKIDPETSINFLEILLILFVGIAYGALNVFRNFSIYFNNFFENITEAYFKELYLKDLIKQGKPLGYLLISHFALYSGLMAVYKSNPVEHRYLIFGGLFILIAFFSIAQYVAFRELFQGRGKSKEAESKVTESAIEGAFSNN
jgi:hypothetical protein